MKFSQLFSKVCVGSSRRWWWRGNVDQPLLTFNTFHTPSMRKDDDKISCFLLTCLPTYSLTEDSHHVFLLLCLDLKEPASSTRSDAVWCVSDKRCHCACSSSKRNDLQWFWTWHDMGGGRVSVCLCIFVLPCLMNSKRYESQPEECWDVDMTSDTLAARNKVVCVVSMGWKMLLLCKA